MWKQPVMEDKPNYMYMYDITIVFIVVANPKVIKMCEIQQCMYMCSFIETPYTCTCIICLYMNV